MLSGSNGQIFFRSVSLSLSQPPAPAVPGGLVSCQVRNLSIAMASVLKNAIAAADVEALLKNMDSEFVYLLDDGSIPRELQAKLSELGFTDLTVFAKLEDVPAEARKIFKADLDLDDTNRGAYNALVARLMAVWEAANKRGEKRRAEEAERKAGDLPRTLPKARHLELQRAFEAKHRELKEADVPAPCYIEARLEQIEDGELIAEPLTDVVSREETREDNWGAARVLADGTLKLQKASRGEAKPPKNSEELRHRIKVMGIAWEFLRLRFPSKPFLINLDSHIWLDYAEWLLGDEVYGMEVKDALGTVCFRPAWHTLLTFEHQVRKEAYKLVNLKGLTLVDAMAAVKKDAALFQKYFVTPTAVAAGAEAARSAAAAASSHAPARLQNARPAGRTGDGLPGGGRPAEGFASDFPPPPPQLGVARSGKGKGGGKGKSGKRTGWRSSQSNSTPDGRAKCFKYQKGQCNGGCGRVHACLVCGGPHPMTQCPRKPAGGDAAGRVQ